MRNRIVSAPLQVNSCPNFPVIQYDDDTIVVLPADQRQLMQMKNLLAHFEAQTGLKVNYSKSIVIPINVVSHNMQNIIRILQCKEWTFPFPYLGLPLSLNKLKIEDFSPMLQRIERRIYGCSTLISYDGRLQLIKSIFSSQPTFFMSCLSLPVAVIDQINKYLRHCFWRKFGTEEVGKAMISCETICKPKSHGGLGVLDI